MFDKNFTCCFTGHRKLAPEAAVALRGKIKKAVLKLIEQGYTTFVTGGALGFDTIAAEVILEIREKKPFIKLIVVAPFANQALQWSEPQQMTYQRICDAADDYICLAAGEYKDAMKKRNLYMVEMSSACIAYCTRPRSGASQTIGFARQNGLEVIELSVK